MWFLATKRGLNHVSAPRHHSLAILALLSDAGQLSLRVADVTPVHTHPTPPLQNSSRRIERASGPIGQIKPNMVAVVVVGDDQL